MKPFLTIFALAALIIGGRSQAEENHSLIFLSELVDLSSGTSQVARVNDVQSLIQTELGHMGFTTAFEENASGKRSGHMLIGTLPGKDPHFITFVTHADTVFEPDASFKGLTVQDGIAKGPGVIDDKGGIVIALDGIHAYLATHKTPSISFRFVVSPSEETGSEGFHDKFKKYSADSTLVLGFEPSLDDGSIVESRRGNRWYLIKVTGREAHAGRDHKKGINACVELAKKIVKLSELTDYKQNVMVSVGHIEGGQDKFNIVCGTAQAKIDTRFGDFVNRDRLQKKIEALLKSPTVKAVEDGVPAQLTFEVTNESPPFATIKESRKYLQAYQQAAFEVEKVKIKSAPSGGSADTNEFSREGLVILDGLGATGGGMHTKEEHLTISSLKTRADTLAKFLDLIL